jgi:hypothetical protein
MEAICSSETSVDFQLTTWTYIPEDGTPDERWLIYYGTVGRGRTAWSLKVQRSE